MAKNYTEILGYQDVQGYKEHTLFLVVDLLQEKILAGRFGVVDKGSLWEGKPFSHFLQMLKDKYLLSPSHPFLERLDISFLLESYRKGVSYQQFEYPADPQGIKGWWRISSLIHQEGDALLLDIGMLSTDKNHQATKLRAIKADVDYLTGLLNRGGIERRVNAALEEHPYRPSAMLLADVDNFKRFNDMFGHAYGDKVLIALSEELKEAFGPRASISRNGGDEFMVFLSSCTHQHLLAQIRDFVLKERSIEIEGTKYPYSISLGYATFPDQATTFSRLYRYADVALYAVKLRGKRNYLRYIPRLEQGTRFQLGFSMEDLAQGLPGAILIYRADPTEQILFANDELVRIFECENLDDFLLLVKGSFRTMVHPEDVQRVEESILMQIEKEEKNRDYVEYRIITKQGTVKEVFDAGRLVHSAYFGDVFYVFLYDKEARRRLLSFNQ